MPGPGWYHATSSGWVGVAIAPSSVVPDRLDDRLDAKGRDRQLDRRHAQGCRTPTVAGAGWSAGWVSSLAWLPEIVVAAPRPAAG